MIRSPLVKVGHSSIGSLLGEITCVLTIAPLLRIMAYVSFYATQSTSQQTSSIREGMRLHHRTNEAGKVPIQSVYDPNSNRL